MNNIFSLRRTAMTIRFFSPAMKRYICYSVASVVVSYLLSLLAVSGTPSLGLFTVASFFITFVLFASPFVFARYSDRTLTVGMPASWLEKSVVMLGFCLIFVPLLLAATWYFCVGVASFFTERAAASVFMQHYVLEHYSNITSLSAGHLPDAALFNVLSNLLPTVVALYVILSSRRLHVLFGILAEFGTLAVISTLVSVYTGYTAFKLGFEAGRNGAEIDPESLTDAITQSVLDSMSTWMPYATAAAALLMIAGIVMVANKIKKQQA